jgi:hypothetical protein
VECSRWGLSEAAQSREDSPWDVLRHSHEPHTKSTPAQRAGAKKSLQTYFVQYRREGGERRFFHLHLSRAWSGFGAAKSAIAALQKLG